MGLSLLWDLKLKSIEVNQEENNRQFKEIKVRNFEMDFVSLNESINFLGTYH